MGNIRSAISQNATEDPTNTMDSPSTSDIRSEHSEELGQQLNEFKQDLERKQEKRREILAEKRQQFMDLREEVKKYKNAYEELKNRKTNSPVDEDEQLKEANERLKLENETLRTQLKNAEDIASKNNELRITITEMQTELQGLNSEFLLIEQERLEYGKQIKALKDVVRVTKDMLLIRENQIEGLKSKVKSVEDLLASKEMKIMSDGLREEYERQLRNIRNLRALYEERQRMDKKDKEHLEVQLDETKKLVEEEQKKNSELQERISELEKDNSLKYDSIHNLESNLGLSKAECKELQAEINIINQLFSQILLGFNNSQEIDLDKLIKILEENHDLLTNIVANEESNSTAAALPKLLLDLINQINKENVEKTDNENADNVDLEKLDNENHDVQSSTLHQLNSAKEIVENLPKVWKILIELLSHQNPPLNVITPETGDPCYKSVETPTGPKLKLSVSQTFIRLKDLILEKKFLERETYRLKHLNTHLEGRLQDQEKRLGLVSSELKKTWHVVGKMQKQHQQLHTHEKVLRYELHQKRILLTELKEELEYCREKWVLAREKQDTTQKQWKELRKEFAARKTTALDDFNNQSAESGYSDDKDSSEDEKGYESDVSEEKKDLELETNIEETLENKENCTKEVGHSSKNNKTELVQNSEERQLNEVQSYNSIPGPSSYTFPSSSNKTDEKIKELESQCNKLLSESVEEVDIGNNFKSTPQITNENQEESKINFDTHVQSEICSLEPNEHEERVDDATNYDAPRIESKDDLELKAQCSASFTNSAPEIATGAIRKEPKPQDENKSDDDVPKKRSSEEILSAREERLQRLEEQCKQLVKKVTNTSQKSVNISNKLDTLHEIYGEPSSNNKETEDKTKNSTNDKTQEPDT